MGWKITFKSPPTPLKLRNNPLIHPHPHPPRSCEKIAFFVVTPVKTGVQAILNGLKILDSGFRRNDGK
jgi:hypothetical protein